MMGSISNFVVDDSQLRRWTSRYGKIPICNMCKKQFKVGDAVESKNSPKAGTRRYHDDCMVSVPRN